MSPKQGYRWLHGDWRPTDRQREVLDAIMDGRTNAGIAVRLGVTLDGAKWHVSELLAKTGLPDRAALAEWWIAEKSQQRGFLPAWFLLQRKAHFAVAAGGLVLAILAGIAWLAPGGAGGGQAIHSEPPPGIDIGDGGPMTAASAPPVQPGNPQPDTRKPFFVERQLSRRGETTIRLSGGDLPHAVTIPPVEYSNALHTGTGSDYSWFRGPRQSASWEARGGQSEPDLSLPRYQLELIHLGADPGAPDEQYWYVPGNPALVGPLPDRGWVELFTPIAGLVERYRELGAAGAISEEPSMTESMIASVQEFGAKVVLERVGAIPAQGQQLRDEMTQALLAALAQSQSAVLVLEGTGVGTAGYDRVALEVTLGPEVATCYYIPPGRIAVQGVLVSRRFHGAWGVSGSGYFQRVYTVPASFDRLMEELGYAGVSLNPGYKSRIITSLEERPWRLIDQIEIWRDGGQRLVINHIEHQPCLEGCDLEVALGQFPGDPLKVAIWPTGTEPFPEAARPALYDYYLDDGA
ncbi:MAG: hypothetical protein GEU75_11860 [Dehalococcoidia bacterium]|nr:hypothetical protein [Dehalococcoidia bacterium]